MEDSLLWDSEQEAIGKSYAENLSINNSLADTSSLSSQVWGIGSEVTNKSTSVKN